MKKKTEKIEAAEEAKATERAEEKGAGFVDDAPRSIVIEEALEAILFAAGHPISYATLARVFNMTPSKVRDRVLEYSLKYNDSSIPRGVILLVYNDSCQLSTKKYYLNEIRDALGIRKSGTLSTSSMEALAIVAYNQPVTRAFVDTLRRADSSYAMNNLIDRGLIESKGRLDAPGRPMLYGTTSDFLRCFGLKDLSELPQTTEEIQSMFANTSNVPEDEEAGDGEQLELNIDGESNDPENANEVQAEATIDEPIEDSDPSADDNIDLDDEALDGEDLDMDDDNGSDSNNDDIDDGFIEGAADESEDDIDDDSESAIDDGYGDDPSNEGDDGFTTDGYDADDYIPDGAESDDDSVLSDNAENND